MSFDLKDVTTQLKDYFERAKADAETFLESHAPGLADVAEKIASDELTKLAVSDLVPAELRPVLAKLLQEFVDAYGSKPAAVEPPAPAEPVDPAVPAV